MDPDAPVPGSSDDGRLPAPDQVRDRLARRAGRRGRQRPQEPAGPGPRLELEGVVEEGVERGAVVLRAADGGTWLVGAAQRHLVGHRVRVRGAEQRGVLTTAQQGPPLVVEDVEDLGRA